MRTRGRGSASGCLPDVIAEQRKRDRAVGVADAALTVRMTGAQRCRDPTRPISLVGRSCTSTACSWAEACWAQRRGRCTRYAFPATGRRYKSGRVRRYRRRADGRRAVRGLCHAGGHRSAERLVPSDREFLTGVYTNCDARRRRVIGGARSPSRKKKVFGVGCCRRARTSRRGHETTLRVWRARGSG